MPHKMCIGTNFAHFDKVNEASMQSLGSSDSNNYFFEEITKIINKFNNRQFKDVIRSGEFLLKNNKSNTFLLNLIGVSYSKIKIYNKAQAYFEKAIKINPKVSEYYNNLGANLNEMSKFEAALYPLKKAVLINPSYYQALDNLGNSYRELFEFKLSQDFHLAAINLKPDFFEAYSNLGLSYIYDGKFDLAFDMLNKSINLNPNYSQSYLNKALCYLRTGNSKESIFHFKKALDLKPDNGSIYNNLSILYSEMGEYEIALNHAIKSVKLDQTYPEYFNNLGNCYFNLADYKNAHKFYEKSIETDYSYRNAYFNLARIYLYIGESSKSLATIINSSEDLNLKKIENLQKKINRIINSLNPKETLQPLLLMSLVDDFETHFLASKHYCDNVLKISQKNFFYSKDFTGKIKVGFYSADFRNHPVMHLIKGLFKLIDRNKFEIIIFSFGNDYKNEHIDYLKENSDKFVNVFNLSDNELIKLSIEFKIEIAVDLMGHTKFSRPRLFLNRLAPIQVNFLGYAGTFGNDNMDYIIGDKVIIPESKKQYFLENIIYMPNTFMLTDDEKNYDLPVSKYDEGLPEGKFIFCCFNNGFKILDSDLDLWSEILLNVKDSVIWIGHQKDTLKKKIIKKLNNRGVIYERIFFAEKVSMSRHLARQKLADLFLDTCNYSAHTTAVDAIYGGLPILTLLGNSFPSRVPGSLLKSIDLDELVTNSKEEFVKKGILFGKNPNQIIRLKKILNEKKTSKIILNTSEYVKNFEVGLNKISKKFRLSRPKSDIYI